MNHKALNSRPYKKLRLPLFLSPVKAGFPSPADDYIEKKLDLNEHLIRNPAATFFLRVSGDSMKDACIREKDLLIVDCSLTAVPENIVVAALNGELTLKRVRKIKGKLYLAAENKNYKPIPINEESDLIIWGVVVHVIHHIKP
ncbi:MAG: translesion error-prone DNA polymerase V autoproteolytic subunit [Spirochaetia bacterium]|nr:translesion error-prone DNA polymerase V autoproteolytic subunit [Spirochaetia bacterium]